MKTKFFGPLGAAILVLWSATSFSADASIVGTWRLVSLVSRDDVTGLETHTWGENPLGFISYSPGGRMSAVLAKSDRPIASETAGRATQEEQAMLFRNSFSYAGRYTLTADGVIHHVEVAADPTWIGKDQRRFARIEGNRLVISSPPIKNVTSPNPVVFSLVWERVE